jgi:hypothetical protein
MFGNHRNFRLVGLASSRRRNVDILFPEPDTWDSVRRYGFVC